MPIEVDIKKKNPVFDSALDDVPGLVPCACSSQIDPSWAGFYQVFAKEFMYFSK